MLEAWSAALTLSTTIPLVPPLSVTAWSDAAGIPPVMSKDMMQPAAPPPVPAQWFVTLMKSQSLLGSEPLLKISAAGEQAAGPVANGTGVAVSMAEFITPAPLKPTRNNAG